MTNDNEAIYELHEQLTKKAAQMQEALDRAETAPREDASGQVSVRLDGDSLDISVGSFWRSSIRPDDLSGVILETVNAALVARLEAWGTSFTDDAPNVPSAPTPSPAIEANEISELVASADGDVFHRNVNRFIDTFSANLGATLATLTDRANQSHTGEDREGRAKVVLDSGGTLIGLELDQAWVGRADGSEVTEALRAALAKARSSLVAARPALPFEGTALAQYAEGMADPVELIRMLTRGG